MEQERGRWEWLLWLAPVLCLVGLWHEGLEAWFVADDFAWLGLLRQVHGWPDFLRVMFAPAAQGTFRFLSERGFFLLFESVFGLDSLPFRICVFVTMAADIGLLIWLTRKATGSKLAGFVAPWFWIANASLATVMAWSSAWNEALCPLFLMSALVLWIRFTETGRRSLWWWQLVVFTLGFGVLEINIVYPAIAVVWVLCLRPAGEYRRLILWQVPLFVISAGYFVLHAAVAPFVKEGPYVVHADARMLKTLAVYVKAAFVPWSWTALGHSRAWGNAIFAVCVTALIAFLVKELTKRRYSSVFFVLWFLLTLGPVLPLPDHQSDYYLTIPLLGVAMLAGAGVAAAWEAFGERAWLWRLGVLIPVGAYMLAMVPATRFSSNWWLQRSLPIRGLVLGVEAAREAHPGKPIVLSGVTSEVYDDGIFHAPFFPLGIDDVYLVPEEADTIHPSNSREVLDRVVLEPAVLQNALAHDDVVIYSFLGDHLRNVTGVYERSAPTRSVDSLPRRALVGDPLYSWLLGKEWLPIESGFRWMAKRATLRLGGPKTARDRLLLKGFCPAQQLKDGPLHLSVAVDGIPVGLAGGVEIKDPDAGFLRLLDVPSVLVGRESVVVEITAERVTHSADGRDLGVIVGEVAFTKPELEK